MSNPFFHLIIKLPVEQASHSASNISRPNLTCATTSDSDEMKFYRRIPIVYTLNVLSAYLAGCCVFSFFHTLTVSSMCTVWSHVVCGSSSSNNSSRAVARGNIFGMNLFNCEVSIRMFFMVFKVIAMSAMASV